MAETAWSLVPPVITIVLALVTKEVYMSLAIGIFIGAFMFTGFNFLGASFYICRMREYAFRGRGGYNTYEL